MNAMMSSTVAVYSFQLFFFRSFPPPSTLLFIRYTLLKYCHRKVTQRSGHTQAFAPQLSVMARDSKQSVYTYSSKRSRTRTSSAFATLCNHPTVMSLRPFIQLFTVCRVTPKRRPNSASLTFFSSSLCTGSAATHNCSFSS